MSGRRFSFAFQPIVDMAARRIVSYEALVRGLGGEPAATVFAGLAPAEHAAVDRLARGEAIAMAAQLGLTCRLNVNVTPSNFSVDRGLRAMLDCAAAAALPSERLVVEITEGEVLTDASAFGAAVSELRAAGLTLAIDDFGAGYSGLTLLADFQPDIIKLDMQLVRAIDRRGPRQAIVRAMLMASADLGIEVIAEGVETADEYRWFRDEGVTLFQGFWVARPAFERLVDESALACSGEERQAARRT